MPDAGRGFSDWMKEKSFGGNFNRLKKWRDDGEIVIWIHTASKMFKRLIHVIGYVGTEKDDKTGKEVETIQYTYFVCHEEVADYMNKKQSGFPSRCPMCRFIDWLETNGDIRDDDEVWNASVGDKLRDKVCSKADFVGDTDAGGNWKMSFKPTLEYVLAVIDDDEPDNGIVVASEKFSLVEDTKTAIINEMDRKGPELGNPELNPYAIKWKFNKKARKASDYYDAYPYEQATITDEIKALLDQPALDLSSWVRPGDPEKLREIMEAHVTLDSVDIPWDIFFDNVQEVGKSEKSESSDEEPASPPPRRTRQPASKSETSGRRRRVREPAPEPEPENENEETEEETSAATVDCPACRGRGKKRGKDCRVCNGTGQIEVDDEEADAEPEPEPEPEKPPKRQRRVRTPAPPPEPEPEPEVNDEDYPDECGNCNKGMPADATECPHCGARYD